MTSKIRDIFLHPDNVNDYQEEDVHSRFGRECLHKHMELNEVLSESLLGVRDGGGEYASWLANIGIQYQTDTGWWNTTAVDPENINAFIEYNNAEPDDNLVVAYHKLQGVVKGLPTVFKTGLTSEHINVREVLGLDD